MGAINVNRVTNANIYLDGNSLLGQAEEVSVPEIKYMLSEHKAIAIAGKAKRHFQQLGVVDGLGHASAHGVVIVFGFNGGNGDIGFEEQGEIRPQYCFFGAVRLVATHHDTACAQWVFAVNLVHAIPPRLHHGRSDEFVTDVAFGELLFVQSCSLRL
jgi:hypothetical protein